MSRIDFGPDMDIRQFRKRHLSQDFGEEKKGTCRQSEFKS